MIIENKEVIMAEAQVLAVKILTAVIIVAALLWLTKTKD